MFSKFLADSKVLKSKLNQTVLYNEKNTVIFEGYTFYVTDSVLRYCPENRNEQITLIRFIQNNNDVDLPNIQITLETGILDSEILGVIKLVMEYYIQSIYSALLKKKWDYKGFRD